jgi:hypothetical protein
VQSVVLAIAAVTVIVTAAMTSHPVSAGTGPFVIGAALLAAAAAHAAKTAWRAGAIRRDARRGLAHIELVLRLEAAYSARRLTVSSASGNANGCPVCGAPSGPHCVCRKR